MKNISNYITEKANFIVKKHVAKLKNEDDCEFATSYGEIHKDVYFKIKLYGNARYGGEADYSVYLAKAHELISDQGVNKWVCQWNIILNDDEDDGYKAYEAFVNDFVECRFAVDTLKDSDNEYLDPDDEDYKIITYLDKIGESGEFYHEIIKGKF